MPARVGHNRRMTKLLVIAGSTRAQSLSKRLARAACALAQGGGNAATFVDLSEFEMPLYDGDLEEARGLPEGAARVEPAITRSFVMRRL